MNALYRKTPAGQAEVASKAHALPPRARSLLIMIDGKRSLTDLRAMLGPAVDEAIALLEREGLVEALREAPTPSAAPPVAPPAPAAPAAPDLAQIRRESARAVTDALGPMGDGVALRIEKAKDFDQLRAALRLAADSIENIGQRRRAEEFLARFMTF
ncbi:MAG: hypothetical protein J0L58_17905 [Burkholderiales bacterium]|nr:hypothetical protein [Burkholderiales bacterium]